MVKSLFPADSTLRKIISIATIVGVLLTLGASYANITSTEKMAVDHEKRIQAIEQTVPNDIQWIKDSLERIENRLDKESANDATRKR